MPELVNQERYTLSRDGERWTRDETILALGLYFQMPWGQMDHRSRKVIDMATKMGRTPDSLAMKLTNIGQCDPALSARGVTGLSHCGKLVMALWNEFFDHRDALAEEYDRCLENLGDKLVEEADDVVLKTPPGLDGVRLSRYRINQSFFRSAVLSAYGNVCCISGINDKRLLIASHIRPWVQCENGNDKTDVRNGLCLSALYDRAFDKGLITIDTSYHVRLSSSLKDVLTQNAYNEHFKKIDGCPIRMPDRRSKPRTEFLQYHNDNVFIS